MNLSSKASTLPTQAMPSLDALLRKPWLATLERLLGQIEHGSLHIQTPDGQTLTGKGRSAGPEASLVLHRWKPLLKFATSGDIGLAESYAAGDWSTPDLTGLLQLGLANESHWQTQMDGGWLSRLVNRLQHLLNDNSPSGSRRNIAFHYDLGNDFYQHWLDPELIYSSAIYSHPDEALESAQTRKLQRITQLLSAARRPSTNREPHILEIGCGWGALACHLADNLQAKVSGITLSHEQLSHATRRAHTQGLASRVDLQLRDYRDLQGQYDHIVSIEMIEAVGEKHWPTYFKQIRQCLQPGGRAVIQAITMADGHFEHYRRQADFIQKYIFPGGMLLSHSVIEQQSRQAGLKLTHSETFGMGYAYTLKEWRKRFNQAWPQIAPLGFDEGFRRMWEYYLCYCEAGFRAGKVDVGLYVLECE